MSLKDTDLLMGPVPEQWKPENQDPSVAYMLNEMTGERTPLIEETEPKKKAGRPKKVVEAVEEPAVVEEPAAEEPIDLTDEEIALLAEDN